jgi:hypothetical protein
MFAVVVVVLLQFFVVFDGDSDWFVAVEEYFSLRQIFVAIQESSPTATQSDHKCRLFAYTIGF